MNAFPFDRTRSAHPVWTPISEFNDYFVKRFGQWLVFKKDGTAKCEDKKYCKRFDNWHWWPQHQRCYRQFSQGPCKKGARRFSGLTHLHFLKPFLYCRKAVLSRWSNWQHWMPLQTRMVSVLLGEHSTVLRARVSRSVSGRPIFRVQHHLQVHRVQLLQELCILPARGHLHRTIYPGTTLA